jgi:hypothetical protein
MGSYHPTIEQDGDNNASSEALEEGGGRFKKDRYQKK